MVDTPMDRLDDTDGKQAEPSAARQMELEAAYEAQRLAAYPYQGIPIRSLVEVRWIEARRGWDPGYGLHAKREDWQVNLSGANLAGAHLRGITLNYALLCNVDARGALLPGANLAYSWLNHAQLQGANLRVARLVGADLREANLQQADLWKAYLLTTNLQGADLRGANLHGASCNKTDFRGSWMQAADLSGAHFQWAYLDGVDLRESTLTNSRWYQIEGTPRWPALPAATLERLRREAASAATAPERLKAMAWEWPGILVQDHVAANPQTPAAVLGDLAAYAPAAFFRNPALPQLLRAGAKWLRPDDARGFLRALAAQAVPVEPRDAATLRAIEARASAGI